MVLPVLGAWVHKLIAGLPPEIQQVVDLLIEHQKQQQKEQAQSLLKDALQRFAGDLTKQ
jgi:hypothetical protein